MKRFGLVLTLTAVAALPARGEQVVSAAPAAVTATAVQTARSGVGPGYLQPQDIPDSDRLLPPPPAAGSPLLARDKAGAKAALALRGTPRWVLATSDAEFLSPGATGAMSCAAGFVISEAQTPAIQKLLRRAMADLGASGSAAKRLYARPRPFMVNNQPTCTPDWEPLLRKDGSYPSGHSALGYGWALLLAEIVPDRATQLVIRGQVYGDSRRVCNVHWLSDIEAGRVTATAVVARLHADPAFAQDMAAAKAEALALGSRAIAPDCTAETAALAAVH